MAAVGLDDDARGLDLPYFGEGGLDVLDPDLGCVRSTWELPCYDDGCDLLDQVYGAQNASTPLCIVGIAREHCQQVASSVIQDTSKVEGRPRAPLDGFACVARRLDARLNQPVVAVVAAVQHVELVALGVPEHEEVVAQQLELQHRLFLGHRLGVDRLGADDLALLLGRLADLRCRPAPS